MEKLRRVGLAFAGDDPKMRRLVRYWGATVLLYLLCIAILWVEVFSGAAEARYTIAFTIFALLGHGLFYQLIRSSKRLGLSPAQLSDYQGRFAIVCTVFGYAIVGPFRGATLLVLLVVLVFCAFTLEPKKTHALSVFAVVLLGLVMLAMTYAAPVAFDPATELKRFVLVSVMVTVVGFLTGRMSELRAVLKAQKAELTEALRVIQELATRDELTALPNRRHMTELLKAAPAANTPACLALLDIDHFKQINDTHGHAVGDEVLREFARQSGFVLRAQDSLGRWGGEEFLLHLPGTPLDAARSVVDRLRSQIGSIRFTHTGHAFGITFSAGLVELEPGEAMDAAISRADALLYAAKTSGRNRVATVPLQKLVV
jgi:diguanylate cyclase (GGDEF)-like protein